MLRLIAAETAPRTCAALLRASEYPNARRNGAAEDVSPTAVHSERCCHRCGMPLAYDAFTAGRALSPTDELCSHCRTASPRQAKPVETEDHRTLLDFMLRMYRSRGIAARAARLLPPVLAGLGPVVPSKLRDLGKVLGGVPRRRPGSDYDALILYSGGKDSSYMLSQLAGTGLRLCAWMLHQGYQSPAAIRNAAALCDKLRVPLVIDRPEKTGMDELFRLGFGVSLQDDPELVAAVMTYGSACMPCFATIAARATLFCAEHDIPLCFIGTQKGQNRLDLGGRPALKGRGLPTMDELVEKFLGPFRKLVASRGKECAGLLDTKRCGTVLVPYYEFIPKPSREDTIAYLETLGWKMPHNTGACSSNCMMNELGRRVMRQQFGFDLYQIIEAHELREMGLAGAPPAPPPIDDHAADAAERMMT